MRKFYFLVVIFVAFFSLRGVSQTVVGEDYAVNYTSSWGNSNNGTGFGSWDLNTTGGEAGHYIGNSINEGFGNVNTDAKAFSMYGHSNQYSHAKRSVSEWASGYSFEIDLAIAWRNGNKGIDIYAAGEEVIFTFNVAGDKYMVPEINLPWSYDQTSIFRLTVLQYPNHLKITLTRGPNEKYSIIIPDKEFSGFQVFVGGDQSDEDLNHIHFNNLMIKKTSTLLFDDFNRDNSNDVGQPSSGVLGVYTEIEDNSPAGARVEGFGLRFSGEIQGRESVSFNMSELYPTLFDASAQEMKWAFNMMTNRDDPSGFNTGDYGAAFVLGCNKPNFTDNDAFGYAIVLGNHGSPVPLRLVKFEGGLKLNSNLTDIASVPISNSNNYLSINISFNSCTQIWHLEVREEVAFSNPSINEFPLSNSGIDYTYTGIDLPHLGALWSHSTTSLEHMRIDNIYIPNVASVSSFEYVWSGETGDFDDPTQWIPNRECARPLDVLVFDGGSVPAIVNIVSTQTIGQLIVENDAKVTLQNIGASSSLSLKGGEGVDLFVGSGSILTLGYNDNPIELKLLANTTGVISGTLRFGSGFSNAAHRILVDDPDALHVKNGGSVEALKLTGRPFGQNILNDGAENGVIFEGGSAYLHASGSHPFGYSANSEKSKVVFESGSLYHYTFNSTPSLQGRRFANYRYDSPNSNAVTGSNAYFIDTLIIASGTLNLNVTGQGNFAGDIEVMTDAELNFGPASQSNLVFGGDVTQKIHGDGTLTFGDNVSIKVDNSAEVGLILEKNITLNQNFTVENGKVQGTGKMLKMTGANSTILVNDVIEGTNVGPGNNLDLIASGTRTNITGTALARFFNITLEDNDTLAISTGLESMHGSFTVSDNSKLMINAGGYVANTNQGFSRSPNYSATSQLIYNTGNAENDPYGRFMEWTGVTNPGYPGNVIVQNGTHISTNKGLEHALPLGIQKDLLIRSGTLNIENNTSKVTIGRDVEIGTEITSGTLDLSFKLGGDLEVKGDFTLNENGTLNANQRAVIFSGLEDQTITSKTASNDITFNYVQVAKPNGELLLEHTPGTTVSITGSSEVGGEALVLSGGDINLQGQTLNLGGSAEGLKLEGDGTVEHIIKSIPPAEFNIKGYKRVVSQDGTKLSFNEGVTVNIEAGMDFGPAVTTINATLQINPNGYADVNAPFYGPLGILKYNTGNVYKRRVEWNGTEENPGYPNDVIITGNTTLKASGENYEAADYEFGARSDVTIMSGSTIDMVKMEKTLNIGGNLMIYGDLKASNVSGSDIHVGGNWERTSTGVFNPNDRQVLFNGSTPQTITADGGETFDYLGFSNSGTKALLDNITVYKDIVFYEETTGSLSGSGKTIKLLGNWHNNAGESAFAHSGSTVSFEGSTLQEVICDLCTSENFDNLKIDNSGEGVKLSKRISVFGGLEFETGLIDATDFQVDFQAGSSNSGSSIASYVNGVVSKTGFTKDEEFKFPVGTQYTNDDNVLTNVYQPAGLIPTTSSPTARFKVDYNHKNYFPGTYAPNNLPPMDGSLETVSTCNYWNIDREELGTDARVRLYWNDACYDIQDPSSLVVAKIIAEEWVSQGQSSFNSTDPFTTGYVESNALSSFSPFTIGSLSSINVLPIELLSFTAHPKGQVVETHWVTSTEINNEYFSVERSVDAENFTTIGRVEGAGNSTTELSYSFTDEHPYAGVSYYRLKQTDFDGKSTYSDIRSVQMDTDRRFELINVYRSEQGVNLTYRSDVEILHAEVFDLLGKRLFATPIHNNNGQSTIRPSLARGVYLLRLNNGVEVVSSKFFY